MSKKVKLVSAVFIVLIALLFSYKKLISSEQVIAKVNGQPIYLSNILKEYYGMIDPDNQPDAAFEKLDDKMKYNVIKSIILGDILEKKAVESKVDEDDAYKKYLANAIKEIRQKVFLDNLISQNVTEEEINAEYKKITENLKNAEEIKVEQLLFDNESEANLAYGKAMKGENFDKIKSDAETQKTPVKYEVLDYFGNGDMLKEFEAACAGLKVGELSKPFKTDFGWHIVKLLDKRVKAVPSLSEMQDSIRSSLAEAFIGKYINDIMTQNSVEILLDKKNVEQK